MGKLELNLIESLRRGIPPRRGADLYSVGYDNLVKGIERHHLASLDAVGKIRFVSGSWGSGKTHFFRLLREAAFHNGSLISNVELSVNEAPLNKFEKVFFSIIRNITAAEQFEVEGGIESAPFGYVVIKALRTMGGLPETSSGLNTFEVYERANGLLMGCKAIDIDFKKMIQEYWKTFLAENPDPSNVEQLREEILQWFAGEGSIGQFRKKFGVNKMISRENAKQMFRSLAGFVSLAGYKGLTILFDEAEQSYSAMRRSSLRDAHNNLLSLINGIEDLPGMFLVYATTHDFFTDPKHGIVLYGALAGRIGQPKDTPPKATDVIWNIDAIVPKEKDFQEAAAKIYNLYKNAYPAESDKLPRQEEISQFVINLHSEHGTYSRVNFWRVLVVGLVQFLDSGVEGNNRSPNEIYEDVMDGLREN